MRSSYVIIDFETTGLVPIMAEVVEIGALKFEGGCLVDRFETLLRPGRPVEARAAQIHGLTNEHLAVNGREPRAEWTKLHAFIGDLPLIAHNGLGFDFQFIFNAFSEFKLVAAPNALIDSCPLAREFLRSHGGFNLKDLCDTYSIKNHQAHRAMGDVMALAELLKPIFAQKPDLVELWQKCGSIELHRFGELPSGFDTIQKAMAEGLEVEIEYQGRDKPPSRRWIRPLHVEMNRGRRYIVSVCLIDQVEKSFSTTGILGVFATRPRAESSLG